MKRRSFAGLAAAAACFLLNAHPPAVAATWPNGPIRIVVPFPAGGTADFIARLAGERLAARLQVPVVVDNRVGANGNIATEAVARSVPDGQTLLLGSTGNLTINPALYKRIGFDAQKDFAPVSLLAVSPNVLVAHPSLPVASVAELIALAKAKPGQLKFASGGNGSTGHLAGELFQQAGAVSMLHVPYRGGPQAVTDLIGGQVDLLFFTVPSVLPHVKSGRLKALAITSPGRSAVLPDLPTIAEAGIKGFDASPWFGLLAPSGTPQPVLDRLAREMTAAWRDEEVKAKLAQQGADPVTNTPAEFAALIKADLQRWAEVVRRAGVTLD